MTTHKSDCATHNAPAMDPGDCDCNAMPEELYIWLADNGNMRKFSKEPFQEGTLYYSDEAMVKAIIEAERKAREQALREALRTLSDFYERKPFYEKNIEVEVEAFFLSVKNAILSLIGEGNGVSPDE